MTKFEAASCFELVAYSFFYECGSERILKEFVYTVVVLTSVPTSND